MRQAKQSPQSKIQQIDAPMMKQMIITAASWLKEHQAEIDALNVFPVPDGDTGTNMYLTLLDATKEVQNINENEASVSHLLEALATGSLMGARGNSGVILSQLFRGFATGVKDCNTIKPKNLACGLKEAARKAYKAVMKPVEGTILTVARTAGDAAYKTAQAENDIIEVLHAALTQAKLTLAKTPEMLSVLKEANVVDAGGKGFCFILEGFIMALKGETAESDLKVVLNGDAQVIEAEALEFIYCTEFLIKGKSIKLEQLRNDLASYGDSLLVVGSTDVSKVHIHTNNPGLVLEYAIRFGKLSKIKIDNMEEQTIERTELFSYKDVVPSIPSTGMAAKKEFGLVAVVAGEGLGEIFESMGADCLVAGGQSMNPSTQELVEGCESIPASRVVILPNNKNVIFAAEQVKEVCSKEIFVVPTKSIPQGIAALMRVNPEEEFMNMFEDMLKGSQEIKTGEVTFAIRASKVNSLEIKEGDIIGLFDGDIKIVNDSIEKVALELLELMVTEDDFLITIYQGHEISDEQGAKLKKMVEEKFNDCDVEIYPGDQPIYYYIFSVE